MLLKKQYNPEEIAAWNEAGRPADNVPKPTHVLVKRTSPVQKFDPGFLDRAFNAGIAAVAGGKVTFKTGDGEADLVYTIRRGPGMYCCHCDAPVSDRFSAQVHLVEQHSGIESPDPCNPAGYRRDHFYFCELEVASNG